MRIVTLNVRNPSFDDGPNAWPFRRETFFGVLRDLDPDVLCLQETHARHLEEVLGELPGRVGFGLPREDHEYAEMCGILVRESLPVFGSGTEWLCETPDVPGTKGWGAACPRVVTWLDLGGWVLFNAHLDHVSLGARTNGVAQVVRLADRMGKPALIAGDLNATPDEPALEIARAAGFADLAEGGGPTFDGFGGAKGWEGAMDEAERAAARLRRETGRRSRIRRPRTRCASTTCSRGGRGDLNRRGSSGMPRPTAITARWSRIWNSRGSSPPVQRTSRWRRSPRRGGPWRRPPSSRGRRRRS